MSPLKMQNLTRGSGIDGRTRTKMIVKNYEKDLQDLPNKIKQNRMTRTE